MSIVAIGAVATAGSFTSSHFYVSFPMKRSFKILKELFLDRENLFYKASVSMQ